jgi:hypothetical protein
VRPISGEIGYKGDASRREATTLLGFVGVETRIEDRGDEIDPDLEDSRGDLWTTLASDLDRELVRGVVTATY